MAFEISILTDVRDVTRHLSAVGKKQLPFAGSRALNSTVTIAADVARKALDKKFEVRNRSGNQGIRTLRISKKDWGKIGARVEWRDYLAQHDKGGRIQPGGGAKSFAIPTDRVASNRTAAGKIRATFKPRKAIPAGRAEVDVIENLAWIARKRGKRKRKSDSDPEKLWFLLRRSITLDPVLKARETVSAVVRIVYRREFLREMSRAIKSKR